jgi:hypothetical protein
MPDYEDAWVHYALMDFERVVSTLGIGEVFALLSNDTKEDIINHLSNGVCCEKKQ